MAKKQWQLPPIQEILDDVVTGPGASGVLKQKRIVEKTLAAMGLEVKVQEVRQGVRATQFSLNVDRGTQLSRIKTLDQDLAVALSGATVQIVPPTPGHPYVAVLVLQPGGPDSPVTLRQVLESAEFMQSPGRLKFSLGLDIVGATVMVDLTELPHLLIGGTTGSGKSTCLNAIIASFLCTYPPSALQLLMIDPLAVELRDYNGLPHLFAPVVTRSAQALNTLDTIDKVIDRRYKIFAERQARDIIVYNEKLARSGQDEIPFIVIAIDNIFDLMTTAPQELEQLISRMARRARGAGVHLILSTPRPDTEALSGSIKANFPGRIAFRVMGPAESHLILDRAGADGLLGQGDMLYKAPQSTELQRVQGILVSETERQRIIDYWKN
jgi:S-DNA-T family DNA segregation ATPase FtsK/SpoIIIE